MAVFKKGDKVKVILSGFGCSRECKGEIVTVLKYKHKGYFGRPGVLTTPTKNHSNNSTDTYDGFIGCESFELVPQTWKERLGGQNGNNN